MAISHDDADHDHQRYADDDNVNSTHAQRLRRFARTAYGESGGPSSRYWLCFIACSISSMLTSRIGWPIDQ